MVRSFKLGLAVAAAWAFTLSIGTTQQVLATDLTIGAAYSLRPAFHEILPMFEREYGATVEVQYGPSQSLRQQIERGAPIDVFLPAAANEVEKLDRKGLTLNGGPKIYAQTSLVLVMSSTSRATPISVSDVSRQVETTASPNGTGTEDPVGFSSMIRIWPLLTASTR